MFADTDQVITTNPSEEAENGAQVVIESSSGTRSFKFPAIIGTRSDAEGIIVRLQDDRYNPTEVRAGRSIRGVYWVNILNSGVGFLIDWMTGAMWTHESFIVVPTDLEGNP